MGKNTKPKNSGKGESTTMPKTKSKGSGKGKGYSRAVAALALVGLVGCTTTQAERVDKALDAVERYTCYARAGENATLTLKELCPTDAKDPVQKSKDLALCDAVPTILASLDKALAACDGE